MSDYNVLVIGAGPGGYVAAIRASQLGLKTAVVERTHLGGICLNWGCIPSKALLRNAEIVNNFRNAEEFGIHCENVTFDFAAAINRSRQPVERMTKGVEFLFKKNKVDSITGEAKLLGPSTIGIVGTDRTVTADNIIIATGARPRSIPALPIDGKVVMTSREALENHELPASVVIVGGGAIGCEFAYLYNAYGAKVTIVELLPHLLPAEDVEISQQLEKSFRAQGISVMTDAIVKGLTADTEQANLVIEDKDGMQDLSAERVLVGIGVQANTENLGLEEVGVTTDKGVITVDEEMRTNIPSIFAIGDVTGKMLLAHVASAQGVAVAESLAGIKSPEMDYSLMPKAVYCHPQVASWGMSEESAIEAGYQIRVGKFPFIANGKALGIGDSEGFAKVIVDQQYGEILGAHLIGPEVTELLAELSMARLLEGTAQEIGSMVHAHPTLSEVVKEATLAARGEAIHI